jgi:D-glycero-alpha-D-manno-heptose-7-phosphate kinase
MSLKLKKMLEKQPVEASAPCRIDMGGTLDIPIFYYPLRHLSPCTFNIALAHRTRVRLMPNSGNLVKISSAGFEDAEFDLGSAPFNHPLGLMFATAAYFNAEGVHIDIDSKSPPRSALGGSSSATVALIGAFLKLSEQRSPAARQMLNRRKIALLAYNIEQTVAGVPCGIQDQLAAAYGGVNVWLLQTEPEHSAFRKKVAIKRQDHRKFEQHLLLAYCGMPHESKDVNGRWVKQFLSGLHRRHWVKIIDYTQTFVAALGQKDIEKAVSCMNRETDVRRQMTPDVLNDTGETLVELARKNDCGARFTGAGGGGCIWALGDIENIDRLKKVWEETLLAVKGGSLLDVKIDSKGVSIH